MSGIPGGFQASVDYDPLDTDGELDIALTDITDPVDGLPVRSQLTLITIMFDALAECDPHDGSEVPVELAFSQTPAPSFGDTQGNDVTGSAPDADDHTDIQYAAVRHRPEQQFRGGESAERNRDWHIKRRGCLAG